MDSAFIEEHVERARMYHSNGFNCAQAVVCSFADILDIDKKMAFKMAEGFGAGMGGFQATCGAISGAVMVIGMQSSTGNIENPGSKSDTYKISKGIVEEFVAMNKSSICMEIKGIDTKNVLRSCEGCIEDAVRIVCKTILRNKRQDL